MGTAAAKTTDKTEGTAIHKVPLGEGNIPTDKLARAIFKRSLQNTVGKRLYWDPQKDITAFELAILTPFLSEGSVFLSNTTIIALGPKLMRHIREDAKQLPAGARLA